jgi:hypothetical protein
MTYFKIALWESAMSRPIYKQKKVIVPLVLLILLVVVRFFLPSVMLKQINKQLADVSPTMTFHVKNLDLAFIWGTYRLRGISGSIADIEKSFLNIGSIDIYADWRSILTNRPVVALTLNGVDLMYSEELMKAVEIHLEKVEPPEEPFDVIFLSRVDIKESTVRLDGFEALTKQKGVILSGIEGRLTNLSPSDIVPNSIFSLQAVLIGSGLLKTVGEFRLLEDPVQWSINSEILHFDLPRLNDFLLDQVPLSFTRGRLDFYSESKSVDGVVTGYIKPFVKDLVVMRGTEEYKGIRHWMIELITAIASITTSSHGVSATRVNFKFVDELKTDTGEILFKAFRHSFQQELSRGIENSVEL